MRTDLRLVAISAVSAAALLIGCSGKNDPPGASGAPAAKESPAGEASPAVQASPAADAVPMDPAEAGRRVDLDEARGQYRSLQDAFTHGGRASASSRARLERALRDAGSGIAWQVACRGSVCRVTADGAVPLWQSIVQDGEPVRRVADRIAVDPDGEESPAYLLLAEENAAPGDVLLSQLATELKGSAQARDCAARAQTAGTIEYELRVDPSGFTYRSVGNLPRPVLDCVDDVLNDLMRGIPVPANARTSMRKVALRL